MNFFDRNPLKRKILEIKKDMELRVSLVCQEKFWIDWYGAYEIDPRHLVFWICVESDEMKMALNKDDGLIMDLRTLLNKHHYPQDAIPMVFIGIESQETVNRESDGDWYIHFK